MDPVEIAVLSILVTHGRPFPGSVAVSGPCQALWLRLLPGSIAAAPGRGGNPGESPAPGEFA